MLDIKRACTELGPEGIQVISAYILGVSYFLTTRPEDIESYIPIGDFEEMRLTGAQDFSLDERKSEYGEIRSLSNVETSDVSDSEVLFELCRAILQSDESSGENFWELSQRIVALGMRSDEPLIRICSINAALNIFSDINKSIELRLKWFLSKTERMRSPQVRSVFEQTSEVIQKRLFDSQSRRNKTAINPRKSTGSGLVLIHGTHFSSMKEPTWHIPNHGKLHNYIRKIRSDIYSKSDFFEWEGSNSDRGRTIAAENLSEWASRRGLQRADFICHSHGGNIVLEATRYGLHPKKLVFLSCPFWWNKFQPRPIQVDEMFSVRVRWDYVILAGGLHYGFRQTPPPDIKHTEIVLKTKWFDHSAATSHEIFEREDILRKIRMP